MCVCVYAHKFGYACDDGQMFETDARHKYNDIKYPVRPSKAVITVKRFINQPKSAKSL